ncbi:hypothetical protein [Aeromonas allosaccharophila]|uniref:hypothetical protein n=1 Tax=Aeromonas allosaccharophila TaxID=656 RepID=UPI003D1B6CF0
MSFICDFLEPKDMLMKLIREGNRINFEDDIINLSDHFFNFSVTAHSLRDWCIKYLILHGMKDSAQLNKEWGSKDFLIVAKDIANSVKHFGVDRYTPKVSNSERDSAKSISIYTNENVPEKLILSMSDKNFREERSKEHPSYVIRFEDGKEIKLDSYVFSTVNYWVKFFDEKSLPRDKSFDEKLVYVNRQCWHKYIRQ